MRSLLSAENYLGFFFIFFIFLFHFAAVDLHLVAVSLLVPAEEMRQSSGEAMAGASQALLPSPFSSAASSVGQLVGVGHGPHMAVPVRSRAAHRAHLPAEPTSSG